MSGRHPSTGGILVTGGTGQLARALARARPADITVVGRPAFDFDRPAAIEAVVSAHAPSLVVNAAAWTAVDAAEASPEAAQRANQTGPALLAQHCRIAGIPLIHLSTDYVFDGRKGEPYVETDATSPAGVYGATKLAGELAVRAACPRAVVVRTSWVYAQTGRNFVLTMLNAAKRTPVLRVVADQFGCPTNADDLAAAVLVIAGRLVATSKDEQDELSGIFHLAGQGSTNWHSFAESIFAAAAPYGWPVPRLEPIATADWPTPARRPPDSRLNCSKAATIFGVTLPLWQPSLHRTVSAICAAET